MIQHDTRTILAARELLAALAASGQRDETLPSELWAHSIAPCASAIAQQATDAELAEQVGATFVIVRYLGDADPEFHSDAPQGPAWEPDTYDARHFDTFAAAKAALAALEAGRPRRELLAIWAEWADDRTVAHAEITG